jgi:hypothetical protein
MLILSILAFTFIPQSEKCQLNPPYFDRSATILPLNESRPSSYDVCDGLRVPYRISPLRFMALPFQF